MSQSVDRGEGSSVSCERETWQAYCLEWMLIKNIADKIVDMLHSMLFIELFLHFPWAMQLEIFYTSRSKILLHNYCEHIYYYIVTFIIITIQMNI